MKVSIFVLIAYLPLSQTPSRCMAMAKELSREDGAMIEVSPAVGVHFDKSAANDMKTYFGYGSNMWLDQMDRRCPHNRYIGVGVMYGWKWIINTKGYATIVPSEGDIVYGLVYEITLEDLSELDKYEGWPENYERRLTKIELRRKNEYDGDENSLDGVIVYIDEKRRTEGPPKMEYIYRMNQAIADAIKEGVPQDYIDTYLRKFIPDVPPVSLLN